MRWNSFISPSELEASYTLFPGLKNRTYARILTNILNRIGNFLGYPLGIIVPTDIAEFEGDEEALRALRLLAKFRKEGFLTSFYFNQHSYGDEPQGKVTMARLKDIHRFGFSGKGADLFDRKATLWPAVGEAVERYIMQFHQPKEGEYRDASWNEISEPKADIFSIAGFDDELRDRAHPLFTLQYDKDTKFRWVEAIELPSKKVIWAPLQWFSFSHVQDFVNKRVDREDQEPLLSIPITTGVAAGQNSADATLRGLLEVIERDAFMIYWLNQLPAKRIDLSSFNEDRFRALEDVARRYRLEVHLLYLETDMPIHTFGAIVIDRSGIGPALIVSAKTGRVASDAAYDVLSDTLAQRGSYRNMMQGDEYKAWRLDDLQKIGHVERMYYWFPKERLNEIEQFISGESVRVDRLPHHDYSGDTEKDLAQLLDVFKEKGYQVFCRELLDEHLKKMTENLSVTMVRVPQMQPLYLEESLRSIGGERLRSIPALLGHTPKITSPDGFSVIPHPFP